MSVIKVNSPLFGTMTAVHVEDLHGRDARLIVAKTPNRKRKAFSLLCQVGDATPAFLGLEGSQAGLAATCGIVQRAVALLGSAPETAAEEVSEEPEAEAVADVVTAMEAGSES